MITIVSSLVNAPTHNQLGAISVMQIGLACGTNPRASAHFVIATYGLVTTKNVMMKTYHPKVKKQLFNGSITLSFTSEKIATTSSSVTTVIQMIIMGNTDGDTS